MERCRLGLWRLCHLAEHLARACLVEAALHAFLADRVEQPQRAHPGRVGRVLGDVEADADVALRAEVVDLVRADPLDELVERGAVAEVAETSSSSSKMWSIRAVLKELERRIIPYTSYPFSSRISAR